MVFFFDDSTMHKIYKDENKYNFISQLSIILYSSLISSTISVLFKQLALSEKNILLIKADNSKNILKKTKVIRKCLFIKLIIYFILGHIFLFFYWFFISCFCVIYINTAIVLIKDTLISFAISMLYPFGINLLPAIFRIISLREQNGDKECLYKFSTYLALI